jgi:hypothetical protein
MPILCRVIRAGEAVPAAVRNKALAVGAERWLHDLPDLVAYLQPVGREMLATADRVARA